MRYIGVDLHKQSITVCVVDQARNVLERRKFGTRPTEPIREWFSRQVPFQVVVEATASYEWFVQLVEPLAERIVVAHPQKLRIIAESTRKSDKLDATFLAQMLARDEVPASYRPTPRQRAHRTLVRHRARVQQRITAVKNKVRRILSDYNADRTDLFTQEGQQHLRTFAVSVADRFVLDEWREEYEFLMHRLHRAEQELKRFAETAPAREQEARALLRSIPGVGFVTSEVVLAELGGVERFSSQKRAAAYAGLAPGQRESAGKRKELHIEKTGSRLLRWVLVEAAWQLVRYSVHWKHVFERLQVRLKKKKAIVAIARRLLGLMVAILKTGQAYRLASGN